MAKLGSMPSMALQHHHGKNDASVWGYPGNDDDDEFPMLATFDWFASNDSLLAEMQKYTVTIADTPMTASISSFNCYLKVFASIPKNKNTNLLLSFSYIC